MRPAFTLFLWRRKTMRTIGIVEEEVKAKKGKEASKKPKEPKEPKDGKDGSEKK